jgi:hypothetical protein
VSAGGTDRHGGPLRAVRRWGRRVRLHVAPDRLPEAEPTTYAVQCAVCRRKSHAHVDFQVPRTWMLRHAGRHPSHHAYREIIVRPWRAWTTD